MQQLEQDNNKCESRPAHLHVPRADCCQVRGVGVAGQRQDVHAGDIRAQLHARLAGDLPLAHVQEHQVALARRQQHLESNNKVGSAQHRQVWRDLRD